MIYGVNWWVYLIVLAVGAPVTLLLHELAHCCAVWWLFHGKVTAFVPWPHKHNGMFYWGRMSWECASEPTPAQYRSFYIWPQYKASIMIITWLFLGFLVWLPLLMAAIWELADIVNFIQGYIRNGKNDGGKYRRAKG